MRSGITTKPKIQETSLTDAILRLCASGRFGVREAIAAATQQRNKSQSLPLPHKPETQAD